MVPRVAVFSGSLYQDWVVGLRCGRGDPGAARAVPAGVIDLDVHRIHADHVNAGLHVRIYGRAVRLQIPQQLVDFSQGCTIRFDALDSFARQQVVRADTNATPLFNGDPRDASRP